MTRGLFKCHTLVIYCHLIEVSRSNFGAEMLGAGWSFQILFPRSMDQSGYIFVASSSFPFFMRSLFGLLMASFGAFWLFSVACGMVQEFRRTERFKWIVAIMSFLLFFGAGGFFATMLSGTGVLKLPTSREWPAGYVKGVITAEDGTHIVPLIPSGRIQTYDAQWRFIRGWNIDIGHGFELQSSPNRVIEVFSESGIHLCSFTEEGYLIPLTTTLPEPFSEQSMVVPTSFWLWPFSSPFLSWGVMVIGFAGIAILRKIGRKGSALEGTGKETGVSGVGL